MLKMSNPLNGAEMRCWQLRMIAFLSENRVQFLAPISDVSQSYIQIL